MVPKQMENVTLKDECSICLQPLESHLVNLSCNHKFHMTCIIKWEETHHYSCPLCRAVLLQNDDIVQSAAIEVENTLGHTVIIVPPTQATSLRILLSFLQTKGNISIEEMNLGMQLSGELDLIDALLALNELQQTAYIKSLMPHPL
jgi:hypothetical protein